MSTGDLPAVILCAGSERWLRARAVKEARRQCVAEGFEETDFVRYAEPPEEAEVVLGALRTPPFGSPRRLVVIDGIEELTSETAPWLLSYLDQPSPTACMLLCADRVAPGFLPKKGTLLQIKDCRPLKGIALEEWAAARAKEIGKTIDRPAAALLVRRIGENLQGLALALEELALLAGDSPRIGEAQVRAIIPPSVQETAFDILETAVAGRKAQAMESLRQATATGRLSLDQFFGAVGWYYRMAGKNRRIPRQTLEKSLKEVLQADVRFKQGHPDPEMLAERLLLDLVKLPGQAGLFS